MVREDGLNYVTCLKYIKERAKIYAEMDATCCNDDEEHKYKRICAELKTFEKGYTSKPSGKPEIAETIPPLTSFVSEFEVVLYRR